MPALILATTRIGPPYPRAVQGERIASKPSANFYPENVLLRYSPHMRRDRKELAIRVRKHIEATTGKVWTGTDKAWIQRFAAVYARLFC